MGHRVFHEWFSLNSFGTSDFEKIMNDKDPYRKLVRIYTDDVLEESGAVCVDSGQSHYLKNVMRLKAGDGIRMFNGRDGEWFSRISSIDKRSCKIISEEKIRDQFSMLRRTHLLFSPIKKQRMDFLVEKAVELGVTDLHPVTTQNTEVRKVNSERIRQQIIEASEQCERMDVPLLHELSNMKIKLAGWSKTEKIMACVERIDAVVPERTDSDVAFLVGPEGGFTSEEVDFIISSKKCSPVSLGKNVLRAETAAVAALSMSLCI